MHIAGASLWIGGLATMVALVWYGAPELAAAFSGSRGSRRCSSRSSSLLIYLSIVRIPHLRDLG